jgi:hypothetical protein
MQKPRKQLTDQEREQRRTQDRERVKQAAQELLSSEGWARWVHARQLFHRYSASNCMLLALAFHRRGIDPEPVAGFRTWLKLGRCVRRGETSLKVLAPVTIKHRDHPESAGSEAERERTRVFFKTASVFSVSQTEPLPGAEQFPLAPPREPLSGDSHEHLIAPLTRFAATLGYTVMIEPIAGAKGGWCDAHAKQIVVDASQSANGQVRTLVHETVHALGVDYEKYTRAQSEVIVDTTTLVVLSGVGLDTSGETIPYVAGWGEDGALDAVTEFATLIDGLARKVENAITANVETRPTATSSSR